MARAPALDLHGFIDQRNGRRAGGKEGEGVAYAYASDKATRATFAAMKPVELAVAAAVRMFQTVGKNELLGHAVKVGPQQFPKIHGVVQRCAETLGIPVPVLYIVNSPVVNAATFGTPEDSFIMVHSALIDHMTDDELVSVIGHECGHIHNSHVVYLTAMHYLTRMAAQYARWLAGPAMLALSGWSRRAEVTCDRAGLLCCGSLEVSTRALTKLALGSKKLYDELNIEAFLDQHREGGDGIGRFAEMNATHPWLPKRVLALRAFADSALFRNHAGLGSSGDAMETVDEKVHEIIKVWG
ncbi:MAG: M48 family metallopeptidase [Polyangiaceae bacterium]